MLSSYVVLSNQKFVNYATAGVWSNYVFQTYIIDTRFVGNYQCIWNLIINIRNWLHISLQFHLNLFRFLMFAIKWLAFKYLYVPTLLLSSRKFKRISYQINQENGVNFTLSELEPWAYEIVKDSWVFFFFFFFYTMLASLICLWPHLFMWCMEWCRHLSCTLTLNCIRYPALPLVHKGVP